MRASGIRVVFTEPPLSLDALRPIARDLGVTLAVLDPLGDCLRQLVARGLPGREGVVERLLFDPRAIAAAGRPPAP